MHYQEFIIHEYRGITSPITIPVGNESIIPIIGVNECGKTTILEALFSFDDINDTENHGRHLRDTDNLFSFRQGDPRVSAEIQLTQQEFRSLLKPLRSIYSDNEKRYLAWLIGVDVDASNKALTNSKLDNVSIGAVHEAEQFNLDEEALTELNQKQYINKTVREYERNRDEFDGRMLITRRLRSKKYEAEINGFEDDIVNSRLALSVLENMGYILYFDDFRHDVPREVEITSEDSDEWLSILENLFQRANTDLHIKNLPRMEERRRSSAIALAEKCLNETLTDQWQKFHLDLDQAKLDQGLVVGANNELENHVYLCILVVCNNDHCTLHGGFSSERQDTTSVGRTQAED